MFKLLQEIAITALVIILGIAVLGTGFIKVLYFGWMAILALSLLGMFIKTKACKVLYTKANLLFFKVIQ